MNTPINEAVEREAMQVAFFAWFAEFGGPYGSIKDAQDVFTAGYRAARAGTGSAGSSIANDEKAERVIRRAVRYLEERGCMGPALDLRALLVTRATKVEAAPGNAGEETDGQRIETIEKFIADAKARGFAWDSMSFDTNATARAQLDARILATPKGPAA